MILEGRVALNGALVTELGTKIDPEQDVLSVDGKPVDNTAIKKVYLVMNKPRGVMCTNSDPEGRQTVLDFCKEVNERIYPVGRLDYLSEGLLILTNDGDLSNRIMHPKYNVVKTYEVKVFGRVSETILKELKKERFFPEGKVRPLSVRVVKELREKTWLEIRLNEGRNREIRRICEDCGVTVDKLKRVAIEGLTVNGIAPGKYRFIERKQLMKFLNMRDDGSKSKGVQYDYYSLKSSVKIKEKRIRERKKSTDPEYEKFRKEHYYTTVRNIEKAKIQGSQGAPRPQS
jgi:23S rRNA pseudouridine2605 synthase